MFQKTISGKARRSGISLFVFNSIYHSFAHCYFCIQTLFFHNFSKISDHFSKISEVCRRLPRKIRKYFDYTATFTCITFWKAPHMGPLVPRSSSPFWEMFFFCPLFVFFYLFILHRYISCYVPNKTYLKNNNKLKLRGQTLHQT